MLKFELRYLRVGQSLVLQMRSLHFPVTEDVCLFSEWQDVPIVEQYTADERDVEMIDA